MYMQSKSFKTGAKDIFQIVNCILNISTKNEIG